MRKLFKRIALIIGSFIGLIAIYLLSAFSLSRITVNEDIISEKEVTIYILTNGVHTDIVVPVKNEQIDWRKIIPIANTEAADNAATLLALGWGDKGFYLETPTWADLKASTAFKAAFGLSTSAVHATYYKKMTLDNQCKKIEISKVQYQSLINYIKKTLILDANGNAMKIITSANYGKHDAFYEANGSYSLFTTCNTWTNSSLKVCGQKASLWTPFDIGIFYHYK